MLNLRRAALALVFVAGALVVSSSPAAAALPLEFLSCDETWGNDPGEGSFRLANNLECPASDGIIVSGSNITIDLNGHRLQGDDAVGDAGDAGIVVTGSNVTIRNGVLDGWDRGVLLASGSSHLVDGVVITRSDVAGVRVNNADGSVVSRNTITEGGIEVDAAHDVQVTGNVLSRSGIEVINARRTVVSGNTVYASPANGIDVGGISIGTRILRNTVLGADNDGIEVDGQSIQITTISGNTMRGSSGRGITVIEADTTRILKNTTTGNLDGIGTFGGVGFAEELTIQGNNASANLDDGIEFGDRSKGTISENRANENGENGIDAFFTSEAVINDNVANFNGYVNGLDDNSSDGGIVASNGTGGGNKARGNDYAGPGQCDSGDPNLCVDGPPDPPVLTTCQQVVTAARTLHNPLPCSSAFRGLQVDGSGYTLALGSHIVGGGDNPGESSLELGTGADRIVITGGVLLRANAGVLFPAAGSPARRITVRKSLVTSAIGAAVQVHGIDATPDAGAVDAGHNVFDRLIAIGGQDGGITITDSPRNRITSSSIIGNGAGSGVDLRSSQLNAIEGNSIFDHESSGVETDDTTAGVLSRGLRVVKNRFIANQGETINLFNTTDSLFDGNLIRGSGEGSGDDPFDLDGATAGGAPGGSVNNRIQNNRIEGNSAGGIAIRANSRENVVQDNVVRANTLNGIVLFNDAEDNRVRRNNASENGADNVDLARDAGILVFDPVDGNEIPDIVSDNVANTNGFLVFDDNGFGIAIGTDTLGSGNTAKDNDHPNQCDPNIFC